MTPVTVIGAGLAGCECAWQLAGRGIPVRLIEMKPKKMTPAHVSENFAELVCSNSLRSDELTNAVGLLKEELRRLDSVVLASADHNRVAAGGALAVDREAFAREITERICAHPNITVERAEADTIPDGEVVIATGPLTSDAMAAEIQRLCPEFDLHFLRCRGPHRHARERGHGQRLFRQPLRQGHGRLRQLPHGSGGVHRLRAGAAQCKGSAHPWL